MEEYGTVKNIKTKEVQKRQKTGNGLFYKGKRGNKAISKKGHDGWDAELYRNAYMRKCETAVNFKLIWRQTRAVQKHREEGRKYLENRLEKNEKWYQENKRCHNEQKRLTRNKREQEKLLNKKSRKNKRGRISKQNTIGNGTKKNKTKK